MRQKGVLFKTFEMKVSYNDVAISKDSMVGLVQFHVEENSDIILGVSIVSVRAANLISDIKLVMQSRTGPMLNPVFRSSCFVKLCTRIKPDCCVPSLVRWCSYF